MVSLHSCSSCFRMSATAPLSECSTIIPILNENGLGLSSQGPKNCLIARFYVVSMHSEDM